MLKKLVWRVKLRFAIWYFKRHPEKFVEKFVKVKLLEYQKQFLKQLVNKTK